MTSTGVATPVTPVTPPATTTTPTTPTTTTDYTKYNGGYTSLDTLNQNLNANLVDVASIPQLNLQFPSATAASSTMDGNGILDAVATETINIDADAVLISASVYVT